MELVDYLQYQHSRMDDVLGLGQAHRRGVDHANAGGKLGHWDPGRGMWEIIAELSALCSKVQ
jgi:hypothetical protein